MEFRYKIIEENGQQVLYIYLDHYYEEFSKELGTEVKERKQNLSLQINDFLKRNNISFRGNLVKILAGSLLFATIVLAPTGAKKANAATINSTQIYEVERGDSLWSIARQHGLSVNELKEKNNLASDVIQPGQELNVGFQTVNTDLYVVRRGDSLWNISRTTNLSIDKIKEYNNLKTDIIQPGQTLLLVANSEVGTYRVQSGDSLWSVAHKYGMNVDDLKILNDTEDTIYPGQQLQVIQQRMLDRYTVRLGDSLWSIANQHNMSVAELQSANNLDTTVIHPGQTLLVVNSPTAPITDETTTTDKYDISTIEVKRYNGVVQSIAIEDYVTGVVASELGQGFNEEAYKAQALAARTYAVKLSLRGETITDTARHQVYNDSTQLRNLWGANFERDYGIIKNAVAETKGEVIEYNGDLIEAFFFSTSNGRTDNPVNIWGSEVPYLKSVDSHWDTESPYFYREATFTNGDFASRLGISQTNLYANVLSRTDGGAVNSINIGGRTFSGEYVRSNLGLRSTDFDISFSDGMVTIAQRGWGHRIGLSQFGAHYMGKEGYKYQEIIKHYYSGVDIVDM